MKKLLKIFLIVLAVRFLFLLISPPITLPEQSGTYTTTAEQRIIYTNQEHNLQVTLPKGWQAADLPPKDYLCAFTNGATGNDKEDIFLFKPIKQYPLRYLANLPKKNMDIFMEAIVERFPQIHPGYKITSTEYHNLNGNNIFIISAVKQENPNDVNYLYFTPYIYGNTAYGATFLTGNKNNLPLFLEFISSLKQLRQEPPSPIGTEKLDKSKFEILTDDEEIYSVNSTDFNIEGDILTLQLARYERQTKGTFLSYLAINLKTRECIVKELRIYREDNRLVYKDTAPSAEWLPIPDDSPVGLAVNHLLNKKQATQSNEW